MNSKSFFYGGKTLSLIFLLLQFYVSYFCYREGTYRYRPGTTAVLHSQITPVEIEVVKTTVARHDDEMETDS